MKIETKDICITPLEMEDSTDYLWHTNWQIVLKSEDKSIGNIRFCGPPNDDHKVEVICDIDSQYQQNEYLVKALNRLWQWVFSKKVYFIQTQTSPSNQTMRNLFVKSGFSRIREDNEYVLFQLDNVFNRLIFSQGIIGLINFIGYVILRNYVVILGIAFFIEVIIMFVLAYLSYRKILKNRVRK